MSNKGFSGVDGAQNVEGLVKIFLFNLQCCCRGGGDSAWAAWIRLESLSLLSSEAVVPSSSGFGSLASFPLFQNCFSHLWLTLRQSLLMGWSLGLLFLMPMSWPHYPDSLWLASDIFQSDSLPEKLFEEPWWAGVEVRKGETSSWKISNTKDWTTKDLSCCGSW